MSAFALTRPGWTHPARLKTSKTLAWDRRASRHGLSCKSSETCLRSLDPPADGFYGLRPASRGGQRLTGFSSSRAAARAEPRTLGLRTRKSLAGRICRRASAKNIPAQVLGTIHARLSAHTGLCDAGRHERLDELRLSADTDFDPLPLTRLSPDWETMVLKKAK